MEDSSKSLTSSKKAMFSEIEMAPLRPKTPFDAKSFFQQFSFVPHTKQAEQDVKSFEVVETELSKNMENFDRFYDQFDEYSSQYPTPFFGYSTTEGLKKLYKTSPDDFLKQVKLLGSLISQDNQISSPMSVLSSKETLSFSEKELGHWLKIVEKLNTSSESSKIAYVFLQRLIRFQYNHLFCAETSAMSRRIGYRLSHFNAPSRPLEHVDVKRYLDLGEKIASLKLKESATLMTFLLEKDSKQFVREISFLMKILKDAVKNHPQKYVGSSCKSFYDVIMLTNAKDLSHEEAQKFLIALVDYLKDHKSKPLGKEVLGVIGQYHEIK